MFNVETIRVDSDDVIILHLTKEVDFDSANKIIKDIQAAFPYQRVIATHPYLINNITIVKTTPEVNYEHPFLSSTGGKNLW